MRKGVSEQVSDLLMVIYLAGTRLPVSYIPTEKRGGRAWREGGSTYRGQRRQRQTFLVHLIGQGCTRSGSHGHILGLTLPRPGLCLLSSQRWGWEALGEPCHGKGSSEPPTNKHWIQKAGVAMCWISIKNIRGPCPCYRNASIRAQSSTPKAVHGSLGSNSETLETNPTSINQGIVK